ncbi:MAG: protein kinase [bacterium]|nr:protein kinase [bacterium]
MSGSSSSQDLDTHDGEILADLFDDLLQEILEGRTPDLDSYLTERPDLRERVAKTWALACSVAGRREASRPVLGGYEILRELGHGGMGTVYLAQHEILQREVAIKVLPHSLAMSPRAKQRFLEEAKALARIRHSNVVHVHRILDHTEMLAFEMEYIDGPSLRDLLQELRAGGQPAIVGKNRIEWCARLGIAIARALAEVHRHGLVHRDIKPANILLRSDGTPVLADFGLARVQELERKAGQHAFAGTPVYAAPERLRGGDHEVGPQTDIYSLGVTLYELLTQEQPALGNTTDEVLRRIERGDLQPLHQVAPHIPADLATIVQKAMETDPRHRFATADELADDLERLLAFEPIHARPAGPGRRFVKFLRRNRRVVTAGVVGAILVAGTIWPIAAHAEAQSTARARSADELHAARTSLLSPASLHTAWTVAFGGSSHQPLQNERTRTAHLAALEATVKRYDEALAIWPHDTGANREREAVAAALRIVRQRDSRVQPPSTPTDTTKRTSATERFANGLTAFLIGDTNGCRSCWQELEAHNEFTDHPLLASCRALQLANEGRPERAYPRLFHATRTFPEATALELATAAAALELGDPALAENLLAKPAEQSDNHIAATRRELLRADLLATNGDHDQAAAIYRDLSARDVSDPLPRERLARLALGTGDPLLARRLLERLLQQHPDRASARLQLARLDLEQRQLPAYLAHVRFALSRDHSRLPPAARRLFAEIVRFGGLDALLTRADRLEPSRASARLPLRHWLPTAEPGIRRVLELLRIVDRTAQSIHLVDERPVGRTLRTIWITTLRLPQLTLRLPLAVQVTLVAAPPLLLDRPTNWLAEQVLPFQRILGNRAFVVQPEALVPFGLEPRNLAFARHLVTATDIDGDTLRDFCIVHPNQNGTGQGRIEVRSASDGTLLRTVPASNRERFGSGFTTIGDVDGDACDDLLIGIPANPADGSDLGSGRTGAPANGRVELHSGRTGEVLWTRDSDHPRFGESLAMLTDLDGDDVNDFLVGAPSTVTDRSGRAFVCSGLDGAVLRTIAPRITNPSFGAAVANPGDIDGDGVADLMVTGNSGNAPGYAGIWSGASGTQLQTFTEQSTLEDFGTNAVGLGDLDGDGHDEFAIAAPAYTGRDRLPGRVLVLDGKSGTLRYELRGEAPGESFGMALCTLPHWRADGRPALAVSAFRGGPTGRGYVRIFDAATGAPLQTVAANPSVRLFGHALADLGDRDGDGLRDLGLALILVNDACGVWSISFAMTQPRAR